MLRVVTENARACSYYSVSTPCNSTFGCSKLAVPVHLRVFWILFSAFQGVLVIEARSPCFLRSRAQGQLDALQDAVRDFALPNKTRARELLHSYRGALGALGKVLWMVLGRCG